MTVANSFDGFVINDAGTYRLGVSDAMHPPVRSTTIHPFGVKPGGALTSLEDAGRYVNVEGWIIAASLDAAISARDTLVNVLRRPARRLVCGDTGRFWIATLVDEMAIDWAARIGPTFPYQATFYSELPYALATTPTLATEDEPTMTAGADEDTSGLSVYAQIVAAQQPALWWRLNELEDMTQVQDSSGHGGVGTVTAGVTLGVAGAITNDATDTAASLDGSGYLQLGAYSYAIAVNDAFTLRLWAKRDGIGTVQTLMHLLPNVGNDAAFAFDATNHLALTGTAAIRTSTGTYTDTAAYHEYAVTKDGSTVVLYVDGAAVAAGAVSNETIGGTGPAMLFVGAKLSLEKLAGDVDEVFVAARALSAAEIAAAYTAASTTPQRFTALTTLPAGGSGTGTPVRALVAQQAGSVTPLRWHLGMPSDGLDPDRFVQFMAPVVAPATILFDPERGEVVSADMTNVPGYWPLSDAAGPALDMSGHSRDLTATDVVFGGDGGAGGCVTGNGISSILTNTDAAFGFTSSFVMVGWMRPAAIGSVMGVWGKAGGATTGWSLTVDASGYLVFRVGNGAVIRVVTSRLPLVVGRSYFVMIGFSQPTGTLVLRVNNQQLVQTGTTVFTPAASANPISVLATRDVADGTLRYFAGDVWEVQPRTDVLTLDDLYEAMDNGLPFIKATQQHWEGQFPELEPRVASTAQLELSATEFTTAPTVRTLYTARARFA